MATITKYLKMTLPDLSDPADISVLNSNFQKIDADSEARGIAIDGLKTQGIQQTPLYAPGETVEESIAWLNANGDTTKVYVLPDGNIYAYSKRTVAGGGDYTNLVPDSIDTDGSIYNGVGYKDNTRLSSSGGVSSSAQAGSVATGFMPGTVADVIRIKGATWVGESSVHKGTHWYINFYNADKTLGMGMTSEGYDTGTYGSGITYDEKTGVTTFDMKKTTLYTNNLAPYAVYFRLNAWGSGADLIVTVNEEIKTAEDTIVYTWLNTGHAFVPADYEERIVVLEGKAVQADINAQDIQGIKKQINDIVEGNTDIAASAKFDPTVYGLPVLRLTGDVSPIWASKDNKVTLNYIYGERSGTCTLKGQGATSYKTAQKLGAKGKYNYTINFDNAFEANTGWGVQKKYCLKANYIDHTHSRNVVSAKLWGMMVKSRTNVNANLSGLVNGGAVDGFPIVIVLNDEFHGLYTWNIPKDGWMMGMVEDTAKTQALVGANDHETATQFKGLLAGDESDFELEFVSDENNTAWVTTSLNRMIQSCMDTDGSDLDSVVGRYLDWDSVIDYYIWVVILKGTDMVDKNYLLSTFDGTKWHFTAYDMDSTYGLNWDGSGLTRPVSNESFEECAAVHRAYELVRQFKTDALKDRYRALRADILSESRIVQKFENFCWVIPSPVLMEDVKKYPSIPGTSVNTVDQIARWVRQRLESADAWMDAL